MNMKLTLAGLVLGCSTAVSEPAGYEIRLKAGAGEPVAFAAAELSRYCWEMFGRPFRCVAVQGFSGDLAVVLAREGESVALPQDVGAQGKALGPDGFVIKGLPGGIAIVGGSPRGVVFGVYTFLERYLGCRWYYPQAEDQIVPIRDFAVLDRLMAQGLDLAERPDFAFREREFRDVRPMTGETDDRIVEQIDWWAKLRMNCFLINFHYAHEKELWARWKGHLIPEIKKRGMLVGIGEHGSYTLFLNPAIYARQHPEWYCEIGGKRIGGMRTPGGRGAQFCTSNKDAVRAYLGNFVAFAKENPEIDVFYPAPNDGGLWCDCVECRKLSVADRYLILDNQVAEVLVKIRPDYQVLHLAYSNHRLPPEKTKPHPNVDIDVACWGRDFAYPLADQRTMPGKTDYLDVFKQWIGLCKGSGSRVIYHCKFMRRLWAGPHMTPLKVLDADMRYLRGMGVAGFDLPLGFVGIWTKAPNAYVVAQKCWDADADYEAIVEEYFPLYYGNCAAEAQRAYELVDEALPSLRYGNNFSLIWREEVLAPRTSNPSGLLEHAMKAEAKLREAVELVKAAQQKATDKTVRARLGKLAIAVRQIRREQDFLRTTASIAKIMQETEKELSAEEQEGVRNRALPLLERLAQVVDEMEAAYDVGDDTAGLLWAGGTHGSLIKSAGGWKTFTEDMLAGIVWKDVGTWRTEEFPDKNTVIAKEIDVTEHVHTTGPVFVRWKWTGGQLGINIYETSLWSVTRGRRTCISKDAHEGFTGARDRRSLYKLNIKRIEEGARYIIAGRIQARAAYGSVAERGSFGKVILGSTKAGSSSAE